MTLSMFPKLKKAFLNSPTGAGALFFIQIFSTFGFAVLYSTLVLYTTDQLGFSQAKATAVMGVFGAFNFGLHLLGGYLGGRWLSNRTLFVIGMLSQMIGCYTMAKVDAVSLYWGLAFFLVGSGLNVTCINMMLTQLFSREDLGRESAFLWNYSGMNLGFFAGFSVAGYFQLTGGFHLLFLLASVGNIIAIIAIGLNWSKLKDRSTLLLSYTSGRKLISAVIATIFIIALVPLIQKMLNIANQTNMMVLLVGVIMTLVILVLALKQRSKKDRQRMFAYLILGAGSMVFWTLYQMAPMALTLFAAHNVDLNVAGIHIAPQWIQNINTVVIVLGGPTMSWLLTKLRQHGYRVDNPLQFCLSLFCIGIGFLILPLGIFLANADGYVAFYWIAISYVLQSLAELLISPIGYAMVGRLAPTALQGVMMGNWMLISGVSFVLASYLSRMAISEAGSTSPLLSNPGYQSVFFHLGLAAVICAIVLSILIPLLRWLIAERSFNIHKENRKSNETTYANN